MKFLNMYENWEQNSIDYANGVNQGLEGVANSLIHPIDTYENMVNLANNIYYNPAGTWNAFTSSLGTPQGIGQMVGGFEGGIFVGGAWQAATATTATTTGLTAADLVAADTAPSIEAQLQTHLDNAVARFDQEGFTPNQAAALVKNPNLGAAYRGSQIDTFFKESVSADANLQNLQITPRFKFGPDVFDPANNVWYDVTTPAQWGNHVLKYTPGFGQGVPLFH